MKPRWRRRTWPTSRNKWKKSNSENRRSRRNSPVRRILPQIRTKFSHPGKIFASNSLNFPAGRNFAVRRAKNSPRIRPKIPPGAEPRPPIRRTSARTRRFPESSHSQSRENMTIPRIRPFAEPRQPATFQESAHSQNSRNHQNSRNPRIRRTPGAAEIPGTHRILPFAEPKISRRAEFPRPSKPEIFRRAEFWRPSKPKFPEPAPQEPTWVAQFGPRLSRNTRTCTVERDVSMIPRRHAGKNAAKRITATSPCFRRAV